MLVVEDNATNRLLMRELLARLGYQADLAHDGQQAVERLAASRYDLVFMDIHMPGMDGFTAAETIRSEFGPEQQPWIVAVTADALSGDRERALAAGMDDYLSKPIRLDALARAIRDSGPYRRLAAGSDRIDRDGPLDRDALVGLQQMLGGTFATLERVILVFLDEAPAIVAAMRSSDRTAVHRAAHTLKGNAADLGASRLSALCRDLEATAPAIAPDDLDSAVDAIDSELERVMAALRRALERGHAG
jgi:CheY-like chemotaxis protein